jgi:8-O-methyltransferase
VTQQVTAERNAAGPTNFPNPMPLLQLTLAFFGARALHSAVELGVFSTLAKQPCTEPELREILGLHPRAARDFLDALVALDLLERDENNVYRPTPSTGLFLNRESPAYIGGLAEIAAHSMYHVWGNLTDALRSGRPQGPAGGDFLASMYANPEAGRKFMAAMDAVNGRVGLALAEAFDWGPYRSVADVGGARGNLAATLVRAYPHLAGITFDLPAVRGLFDEHIAELGLTESVTFQGGDFEQDPLPEADVLVFGHVLHGASDEDRKMLLGKAFAALPPGGRIAIYDRMIADDRRGTPLSLLGSLNMLLTTPGGSEYTPSECRVLLEEAGFVDFAARPVAGTETLVTATKPERS